MRGTIESEGVGKFGKINDLCIFFFHRSMQSKLEGSLMGHLVKLNAGLAPYSVPVRGLLDLVSWRISYFSWAVYYSVSLCSCLKD